MTVKEILEREVNRASRQADQLRLSLERSYGSEFTRISGKIEGVNLIIENLRQTIKELED